MIMISLLMIMITITMMMMIIVLINIVIMILIIIVMIIVIVIVILLIIMIIHILLLLLLLLIIIRIISSPSARRPRRPQSDAASRRSGCVQWSFTVFYCQWCFPRIATFPMDVHWDFPVDFHQNCLRTRGSPPLFHPTTS